MLKAWKTVTLGLYPDIPAYERALRERGVKVIADLDGIEISKTRQEVGIVHAFSGTGPIGNVVLGTCTRDILRTAAKCGLKVCSHEIALALALSITNEDLTETGGHVIVGAPPRAATGQNPYVAEQYNQESMLYLERDFQLPSLRTVVSNGEWNGFAFGRHNRPIPWIFSL